MEFVSTQKYLIISPTKVRPVVSMVKKMSPLEAVKVLPYINQKGAMPLRKVIDSAIANAKDQGVDESLLFFKEIQINEGPRLKRGREVSRGRWHPYKKRMSHIRVVLYTKEIEKNNIKETGKSNKREEKKLEKVKEEKLIKKVDKKKGDK